MEKTISAVFVSVVALGAANVDRDDQDSPIAPPSAGIAIAPPAQGIAELGGKRNLRLDAFGTRQPGPGQLRIPVPADGAMYEVIVEKPGLPRSVRAASK